MRILNLVAAALVVGAGGASAQEIVEVPASKADVARPDDLFRLPPGQWYTAKLLAQGSDPCTPSACEAGFNSGDLVVSVEHAGQFSRVIAGFRGCDAVAFNEVETGVSPGSTLRGELSNLIRKAVKAAEKSCKVKAPKVPKLDVASLFPKEAK